MQIIPTAIADLLLVKPAVFSDARGYFLESYNRRDFFAQSITSEFVQDSASFSQIGTLRGLHYQKGRHAQAKLVRVVCGHIADVALDIRAGSPSFGRYVITELSGENNLQLFIPKGFAHGFVVLSETAHVAYKTDAHYAPDSEGAINAFDPELSINWGLSPERCLRSDKDRIAQSWAQYCLKPDFVYDVTNQCC